MFFSYISDKVLNINRFTLFDLLKATLLSNLIFCNIMQFLFKNQIMLVENCAILIDIRTLNILFFLWTCALRCQRIKRWPHTGRSGEDGRVLRRAASFLLLDTRYLQRLLLGHEPLTNLTPKQMILLLLQVLRTFTNDSLVNSCFINIRNELVFSFNHVL